MRSITQPLNRAAIPSESIVALYSDAATIAKAGASAGKIANVEPHIVTIDQDAEAMQQRIFANEVRHCYENDCAMVVLCPDNFWGDGSLANLLSIAGEQRVCIAAPHVRVDQDQFLKLRTDYDFSNFYLVGLSMAMLHPSWIDADASKEQTSSFYAGISVNKIGEHLWAVTHLLPTIWYAHFTKDDVDFFANPMRGAWDHIWPKLVVSQGRQRIIGSSDAFFVAELTPKETHGVPLMPNDKSAPDRYCRSDLHIEVNRNTVAIWRG